MNQPFPCPLPKIKTYLTVLFTVLTLGAYIGFWFLNRKDALKELGSKYIPFRLWILMTVYLVASFILFFVNDFIFTPYGQLYIESFEIILVYLFFALLYYSIFRVKELLEEEYLDLNINVYLLFFFHIWYLQFKINQLLVEQEKMERAA